MLLQLLDMLVMVVDVLFVGFDMGSDADAVSYQTLSILASSRIVQGNLTLGLAGSGSIHQAPLFVLWIRSCFFNSICSGE